MSVWHERAACRGKPSSIFFPDAGAPGNAQAARAVCAGCPVSKECLEYALTTNQEHGIWGGLNISERRVVANGAVLRIGQCAFCTMPFTFWWEKGKAPKYCSDECLRKARNKYRREWRGRRFQATG